MAAMEADRRVLLAVADARFRVGLLFFVCAVAVIAFGIYAEGRTTVGWCAVEDPPMALCGNVEHLPNEPKARAAYVLGDKLFKANCASCHKPDKRMTGPALKGAKERWAKSGGDLYAWVKNSQGYLVTSKDPYAHALFEAYDRSIMTPNAVTNEDIDAIMAFVEGYRTVSIVVP